MRNNTRRMDLDYAKGIAIFLLIFMHTGNPMDYKFKICISAFFMPIFYIVCGMLVAIKNPNGLEAKNITSHLMKRFRQILIPYFIFGFILIAFFQGLHLIAGEPFTLKEQLFKLFTLQGIESMWFLTRYLAAEIIFLFLYVRLKPTVRVALALISVIAIAYLNHIGMPEFWLLPILVGAWIGLIFTYFGFLTEKNQIIRKLGIPAVVVLLGILIFSSLHNGFIGVGALELQNVFLFFVNGAGLSIVFLYLCSLLTKRKMSLCFLETFGQNTIVVVCTNNLIIEIIRLLDYKLTGNLLIQMGLVGNFLFAIVLTVIEYAVIRMSSGKLAIIFGKKPRYHKGAK